MKTNSNAKLPGYLCWCFPSTDPVFSWEGWFYSAMRRKPKSNLKNGKCKKRKQGREMEGRVLKLSTNKSNKGVDVLSRRAHRGSRSGIGGGGGGCARNEAEWSNSLASRSTRFVSWCWASGANNPKRTRVPVCA